MRILIANDDGIEAEGIQTLAKTLAKEHEVYVFAPKEQQSAVGHGISMRDRLYVENVEIEGTKMACSVTGKPADCVEVGLYILKERGINIDIVFTGINHGGNFGYDTHYSGTISSAIEGNFCGKPAVAVSVNSHFPEYGFEYASDFALRIAQIIEQKMEQCRTDNKKYPFAYRVISINVPDLPKEEIKGVKLASVGPREYSDMVHSVTDESGRLYYEYGGGALGYKPGDPFEDTVIPEDNDVVLCESGYVTISPILHDLTDYSLMEELNLLKIY